MYGSLSVTMLFVALLGDASHTLDKIMRLKSHLVNIIEPHTGLYDLLYELVRLEVLTYKQRDDVLSQKTERERNSALLDLLVSQDQCVKFVTALQRTRQQAVIEFIVQSGGQQHYTVVSSVVCDVSSHLIFYSL